MPGGAAWWRGVAGTRGTAASPPAGPASAEQQGMTNVTLDARLEGGDLQEHSDGAVG